MTIFKHEMKMNIKLLAIWSIAIGVLLMICMMMFPQISKQMDNVNEMYSSMGSFTEAFGMDKINFGTAIGFYGIECGSMLGIGGSLFAAMLGIGLLSKEEGAHTAEFLFTHGISRHRILLEKLLAMVTILILFNAICMGFAGISFAIIGEEIAVKEFLLFHLAQVILQFELAGICFGISAFLHRGGMGLGIGIAALMYFFNIVENISKDADWIKYITPFHYADAANIISEVKIDSPLMVLGCIYMIAGIVVAFAKYCRKDLIA